MEKPIIIVTYFAEKENELVSARFQSALTNINLNQKYVSKIREIPTAYYDMEKKSWLCTAKYGKEVEEIISECFPDSVARVIEQRISELAKTGSFAEAIESSFDLVHLGDIRDYLSNGINNGTLPDIEKAQSEYALCIGRMKHLID